MKNKKFIAIFIFIPLSFLLSMELYIYAMKDHFKITKSILKVRDSNVTCLIVGDSHTGSAFGYELDECVNLSLGGTSIPMNSDIVYSVSKNNPLKIVILSLGPHNFSNYRVTKYSPMFKNISLNNKLFYKPLLNVYAIRKEVKNSLIEIFLKKGDKKEWSNKTQKERHNLIDSRLKKHAAIKDFENTEYANIYKTMVDYLVKNNIDVYLVRTPVVKEYDKRIMKSIGHKRWKIFIKNLTSTGAVYIDFKDLNFNNNNMNYFSNQDHLNQKGAAVFYELFKNNFLGY